MAERLQKVMANAGIASRRASEKIIMEGRVMVNGQVVKELGIKVEPSDVILVDGTAIEREDKVYILFYKPRGVLSAASDKTNRKVVTDFFNDLPERIYPVGRLDYDTSGLLIMTNDGELANQLMHPRYKIKKTYVAKVKGIPTNDELKLLRTGVMIDGSRRPVRGRAKIVSTNLKQDTAVVSLTINEGRYHQVKKMFEKINHPVQKLKRESYAFLDLRGLTSGDYRYLTHDEVSALKKLATEGK